MNLFDVYPLYPIRPEKGEGSLLWDAEGNEYIDLYGGHAVISIGHSHPHYVQRIYAQLRDLAFYSNSVEIPIQHELANKLGEMSGYPDYSLFLVNSGAEAIENALKLASFTTGRKKVLAFKNSFHGRTSLAVAATDNLSIVAPINESENVLWAELDDFEGLNEVFLQYGDSLAAVIIEGIQGYSGIYEASTAFWKEVRALCNKHDVCLVADEVQSGYGRTGKFFAHQYHDIIPDLICVAKGMGNGFPIGGVLISPCFQPKHGMLGTTFGGNHLACAAGLAVLEVMESEQLMTNSLAMGAEIIEQLKQIAGVKEVRGRGLMIGIELHQEAAPIRTTLLKQFGYFTGSASNKNTIRLLPALNVGKEHLHNFLTALKECLSQSVVTAY